MVDRFAKEVGSLDGLEFVNLGLSFFALGQSVHKYLFIRNGGARLRSIILTKKKKVSKKLVEIVTSNIPYSRAAYFSALEGIRSWSDGWHLSEKPPLCVTPFLSFTPCYERCRLNNYPHGASKVPSLTSGCVKSVNSGPPWHSTSRYTIL